MRKLLVDVSSVVWMSLLAGKDVEFGREVEFNGKKVWINGWQFGLDCAINHLTSVMRELSLSPADAIFVVEGQLSKAMRRAIYSGYKAKRDKPEESYPEFNRAKEELVAQFRNAGAQIVIQDGVEADDVIAYLVRRMDGTKIIRSNDGDMIRLLEDPTVFLYGYTGLTQANKYGPFDPKYLAVYKALVGDGEEYKGAYKFGEKAFLDLLVWGGDGALPALEAMMQRRTLHELEDDVAEFKPMRKIIDGAEHVYQSYDCALLHDEWVDTKRQPLRFECGATGEVSDPRIKAVMTTTEVDKGWWDKLHPAKQHIDKMHAVYDIELIGDQRPVFLVCVRILETNERFSFWHHVEGDLDRLAAMVQRDDLTWVSFNGDNFDAPIMSAALAGKSVQMLKTMANLIVTGEVKRWVLPSQFDYDPIEFDHIDLYEVAPGVQISLKTYAGRLGYPSMIDLPFEHDRDLTDDELPILETYCHNDLGVTLALFAALRTEVDLRTEMSQEHDIDLRSKSDAQVAEAVLKKIANITKRAGHTPPFVTYKAPTFIQTDSDVINEIIERIERTNFTIHQGNGQVQVPEFLDEPVKLGYGTYQMGVGGLHSTHDKSVYFETNDDVCLSDFDVASYYPNIMLKAGLTPRLDGGAGQRFIDAYRDIYDKRIEAKRAGNKKVANALKISLNGTFGKLGSPYSSFYSPDLMLAVTLTGQLNLMCLIYDLEYSPSIRVVSANTDGITVMYPASERGRILRTIRENALRTGFEYEETRYWKEGMKDVNNYIAITSGQVPVVISPQGDITDAKPSGGKAKRKGLYASNRAEENPLYLMKNPTMEVCSNLAVDYLKTGIHPRDAIKNYTDIRDFVAIRNVKGGGIQYDSVVEVDDWVLVYDQGSKDNGWFRQAWFDAGYHPDFDSGPGTAPHEKSKPMTRRKSRPAPVEIGVGGQSFGRIARWYMSNAAKGAICYIGSGNKVPKTNGAQLCMTLPDQLPDDIDLEWYVNEAISILGDLGVDTSVLATSAATA